MPEADAEKGKSTSQEFSVHKSNRVSPWIRWAILVGAFIAWLGAGVWVSCMIEGWSFVTSLYVMVQIVTTIGYGDISMPASHYGMKVFISIYVFIGVVFVAALISNVMTDIIEREEDLLRAQIRRLHAIETGSGVEVPDGRSQARNKLIATFISFLLFVAFGTIFYATYEACSCSYGVSKIEGCVEGPTCPETGGAVKTWIDAFYMSVITLTTVGFGDHSPKSFWGRVVGIFWMLLGIVATANFIQAFGDYFLSAPKEAMKLGAVDKTIFNKIDKDGNGSLDGCEFRTYMLLKHGLVQQHQLDMIDEIYKAMDTDQDGKLTWQEVKKYFDLKSAREEKQD